MSARCMRPGPITKNGYLNFLREFRQRCCGMTAVQTVVEGAKAWRCLSCAEKAKYRLLRCGRSRKKKGGSGCKRKRSKRQGCGPKKTRRSSCRKKKRRRPTGCRRKAKKRAKKTCKKKRCREGPVTNNPFLNFLRVFRRKHCGLSPKDVFKQGAKCWRRLSCECKKKFYRQACKMSKSPRKKKSRMCRCLLPREKRRC